MKGGVAVASRKGSLFPAAASYSITPGDKEEAEVRTSASLIHLLNRLPHHGLVNRKNICGADVTSFV
jgi:hypothetical protein